MYIDPENRDEAKKKIRDASGKFVGRNVKPEETAARTVQVTGPLQVINEALVDPSEDKPLISFTINNPLRKLLQWIKEIKRKQTTTFEFKIKVPLIALPVFMVVLGSAFTFFFNLGKAAEQQNVQSAPSPTPIILPTATPAPYVTSKVGVIKATYQVLGLMAQADLTPTAQPTQTPLPSRYVLFDKDENIIFLVTPSNIKLDSYLNKRVLVTGKYDQIKSILSVEKPSDVEVLP